MICTSSQVFSPLARTRLPRSPRGARAMRLAIVGLVALGACDSRDGARGSGERDSTGDGARDTTRAARANGSRTGGDSAARATAGSAGSGAAPLRVAFRVPSDSEIRDTVVLASVRRGRALVTFTRDSLPRHVGNKLQCVNCHTGNGLVPNEMPFIGVYARFPQYRSRSGGVQIIEDRINDCFERSMNGRGLARDSRDMRDIVAYMAFLSYGIPVGAEVEGQGFPRIPPLDGDTVRGKDVYAARCASCHAADGDGTALAPPVWGPDSYNIGAGMARVRTAAAFIHKAMPRDRPGSLTPQEAYDVATYINTRPRPDFAPKALDWPHGDPPPDVAYPTKAGRRAGN